MGELWHTKACGDAGLSRERFLADYYAANRPTVLTDVAADNWPAAQVWTPCYLKDTVGAEVVEVMAGRENGTAAARRT